MDAIKKKMQTLATDTANAIARTTHFDDEIAKIRDNELAVAAAAQKEIIKIQEKLNVDIQAIKDKYQASIDAITTNVTKLTGEAEATTGEIEVKADELEGKLTVVYANIDDLNDGDVGANDYHDRWDEKLSAEQLRKQFAMVPRVR